MEIELKLYSNLSAPFGEFCHAVRANGFLFLSGFTTSDEFIGEVLGRPINDLACCWTSWENVDPSHHHASFDNCSI